MLHTPRPDSDASGTRRIASEALHLGEASDRLLVADIYALGCVVYFLVTGHLVFEGETPMKTLVSHVEDPPVPPSQRTETEVPKALEDLILACLEKDPARRPQDAQALLDMARGIRLRQPWDQEQACEWWNTHLPELCAPVVPHLSGDEVSRRIGA